jgi:hypothetical protein
MSYCYACPAAFFVLETAERISITFDIGEVYIKVPRSNLISIRIGLYMKFKSNIIDFSRKAYS